MNENEIKKFDLNLLLILHVLLEERSVSRAAERMNLSQSAISHALTRLRYQLGDPLFIRGQRGIHPTQRAESLAESLRQLLESAGGIISRPTFDASKYSGVFRITATDYGSIIIFPELVRQLEKLAPNIMLECLVWNEQTLPQLENGRIDLALGGQNPFEEFEHMPLFTDRLVFMVDRNHPLAVKRKITAKECVDYPHVVISVVASRMKIIDDKLAEHHLFRRVVLRLPHFISAPSIIRGTDMILTIPEVGARKLLADTDMRILPLPFSIPDYDYIQIWGKKQNNTPLHQWMRQTIRSVCHKFS